MLGGLQADDSACLTDEEQLDDVVDFLDDWGADSDDGDLPEPQPAPEPAPEREPRDELAGRQLAGRQAEDKRVSVCLGLAAGPQSSFEDIEKQARAVDWSARALRWLGSKPPSAGCGFYSKDMYTEFAKDLQDSLQTLPGWWWLDGRVPGTDDPDPEYLTICCSVLSPKDESSADLATALLGHLQAQLPTTASGTGIIYGLRVWLVSEATKIPLMPLARGLGGFVVSKNQDAGAVAVAAQLLDEAGMCVMTDAVTNGDIQALAQLAMIRTAQIERALASTTTNPVGKPIGSGDVTFAEICSRGVQRWDMLLHPPGQPLVVTGKDGADQALIDAGFTVLQRVATNGPWVAALETALGLDANGYKWQASIICSRPGAPAGHWHADGPHSRHMFGGEAGRPYGFCVFVPLVPLVAPQNRGNDHERDKRVILSDGELRNVQEEFKHGLGCTVFWPGSHRHVECVHLGSVAASSLGAVISGAPMRAGSALVYDYRLVHCAAPNDYEHSDSNRSRENSEAADGIGVVPPGDRPILQLVYTVKDYNDVGNNYGYYQLFEETDIPCKR